jgi:hypothetical protein
MKCGEKYDFDYIINEFEKFKEIKESRGSDGDRLEILQEFIDIVEECKYDIDTAMLMEEL